MFGSKRDKPKNTGTPPRVLLARFIVDVVLIGVTVSLIPGVTIRLQETLFGLIVLALSYGLLVQFVRPILNMVLLPYLIQSYGLVLILVDALLFGLLMLLFSIETGLLGVLSILVAGALLGVVRLLVDGLLGLTPPISPDGPPAVIDIGQGLLSHIRSFAADRVRLLRIRQALFRHGIDALFDRGPFGAFRRKMQRFLWRPDFEVESLSHAVRFRLLLQDLGPTYIKIGQIISSRARMLPDEWQDQLEKLESDAPEFPYAFVEARIVDELGASPSELYEWFDKTPLAAASLAQVHRARLHSGVDVAVKVQRPNIQTKLKSDVELLVKISAALTARANWAEGVDLAGIVEEFGNTLLRELDYTIEAYNARRLATVLEPVEGVRVPKVHHELSSGGVLTLEFIRGVKSTDRDAIVAAGFDTEVLADNMVRAAVKMLVFDGFFHADPHPGNVFVDLDTGELIMLDTGMVGELSVADRVKLAGLGQAVNAGDVVGMAQSLKSISAPFRETDDARFYREVKRVLTPFLNPAPGERIDVSGKVLPTGMSLLRDAGYRIDSNFTLAIKSMTQAEAITAALVPEWSGTEFMTRSLAAGEQLAEQTITSDLIIDAAVRQATFVAREFAQELPSIEGGARKWIDSLKDGGVTVKLDTSGLDKQMATLRATAQIVTLGILATGLLIGSAIAAAVGGQEDSPLGPVVDLAMVTFTFTSVCGVLALVFGTYKVFRKSR